ncbi:MAG: type II CRISPR-associated endonuclease Cas1 [candidate division WOR-3 bacterium]
MLKRILYFGNPTYLSTRLEQLVIRLPEVENNPTLPDQFKKEAKATVPIEDIGALILDHPQIILSHALLSKLLDNNVAVVSCNNLHHPTGLMLNLSGHTLQAERFKSQLEASVPLRKQLWQATVKAKIRNQAYLLKRYNVPADNMLKWATEVTSGDEDNMEARAASYYWKNLFPEVPGFVRKREGPPPNHLLNYAYAILRAMVARSLVGSGLLPTLGIHHHNRYNHYCLADDIMEPYRPFADALVKELVQQGKTETNLNTETKKILLGVAHTDVLFDDERSPLMVGVQRTTASLAKCFEGTTRKLLYPRLP